jgi:HEAT repeat protein
MSWWKPALACGQDLQEELLQDANEGVRMRIAENLGFKTYPAEQAVPLLRAALKDEWLCVRGSAAMSLEAYGAQAVTAVPDLLNALADSEVEVRAISARALGEIGDKSAVPFLITSLRDQAQLVRWFSACALGKFGTEAGLIVPALVAALKDKEPEVCRSAAAALGEIGPSAHIAVSSLRNLLHDKDWMLRVRAAYALWQIDHQVEIPLPILVAVLKQGDAEARAEAASALGNIGPPAQPVVPALIQALEDYEYLPIHGAFGGFPCSVHTFARLGLIKVDPEAAVRAGVDLSPIGDMVHTER